MSERMGWVVGLLVVLVAGCEVEGASAAPARDRPALKRSLYVASSTVFGADSDSQTTYVSVLDSLAAQKIDYDRALELTGWADTWVHEGELFVSGGESPTITRYRVSEQGEMSPDEELSFAAYGLNDVAFWSNTFVAPDKAYMINGVDEYVIWNPVTMEITGTLELPELEARPSLLVRAGTTDRSNVIRNGVLYQPMYWSDEDYVRFAEDSRVIAIDIVTDRVLDVIEAPCAGLDVGTRDDAGNLYFSTWTGGVWAPLALGAPANCVAKIAADEMTATRAFTFADVADGREGAAVRAIGPGRLALSVFHDERVELVDDADPDELLGGENWRLWSYDPATEAAETIDGIEWNSGATYAFDVDGKHRVLVPGSDYTSTTVYELAGSEALARFEMQGWGIRLFKLR
jgi:hypothetical protein